MPKNDVMKLARREVRQIFKIYDTDSSESLDKQELRLLVDKFRDSLYLPKSDDNIFERVFGGLDVDGDGKISLKELLRHLDFVYPILTEVGKA